MGNIINEFRFISLCFLLPRSPSYLSLLSSLLAFSTPILHPHSPPPFSTPILHPHSVSPLSFLQHPICSGNPCKSSGFTKVVLAFARIWRVFEHKDLDRWLYIITRSRLTPDCRMPTTDQHIHWSQQHPQTLGGASQSDTMYGDSIDE